MVALDQRLLQLLDQDARQTLSEMGKALRLSKSAVSRRIENLEKTGIIQGYYTIIDARKLGYLSFRTYIKFNKTTPAIEKKFIDELIANPRVWWVGLIQGTWDLGFVVWAKDPYEFRKTWMRLLRKYRKYVGRYQVFPYTNLKHYPYFSGNPQGTREDPEHVPEVKLDKTDLKILRVLAVHARWPITRIALQTGLTPAIVKYRMRELMCKGVIQNFRTNINTAKLGYAIYKLDVYLEDLDQVRNVYALLESFPSLVYIDETVGGADVQASFYFRNAQELELTLAAIKKKFAHVVREYEYFTYNHVLKHAYFPD